MKAKHTAGPWNFYSGDHDGSQGAFIANVEETKIIARLLHYEVDGEVMIANARLISAAPDMLEALKIIIKYARGEYPRHQEADIVGVAKEAIAKAEKGE